MPKRIKILIQNSQIPAELFDTECAQRIYESLPIESEINEWGDEFYFSVGIKMPLDNTATTRVKTGDIGYWPVGQALAIFFGPTPASSGSEPVAASEVNIVGRILVDPKIFKSLKGAKVIRIEKE